jgi:hypothetical protein
MHQITSSVFDLHRRPVDALAQHCRASAVTAVQSESGNNLRA